MTMPRTIVIDGERRTIAEIAKRAGISPQGIRLRLRAGVRGRDLLAAPRPRDQPMVGARPHDVGRGRRLTVREIAAIAGVNRKATRERIRRGERGDALPRPPAWVHVALAPPVVATLDGYAAALGISREEALERAIVTAVSAARAGEPVAEPIGRVR